MVKKITIFNPSIEDGGVEKNLFLITNFFALNNIKTTIISADKSKKKEFIDNVNFIYPKNINFKSSGRYKKYFFCLLLLIKRIIFNKDKFIFSFQANIYCIIVAKLLGAKIIVRMNTAPQGWYHNYIKKKLYNYFIKKADGIIVNSRVFQNEIKKRFNVKSIFINNPFDFNKIRKLANKKKKKLYPKNCLKLISIGRMTEQKDQITILKSLLILKKKKIKFKLLLLGKGYLRNKLEKFINENGLKENVKFLGYQSNPFSVLKQADIFILSSLYEGSPNVLIEALFLRKKIITTDCPTGPSEILSKKIYGEFFKMRDYNQLANKIIKVKKIKKKNIPHSFFRKYDVEPICRTYRNYVAKSFNF